MDLLQIKSLVDAGVKVLYDESHPVIKNEHGDYYVLFMGTASSMPLQVCDPAGPLGQHALNGQEWAFTVATEEVQTRVIDVHGDPRPWYQVRGRKHRIVAFDNGKLVAVCQLYAHPSALTSAPTLEEACEAAIDLMEIRYPSEGPWAPRVRIVA